jgi:glycine cleavage system H protein
MADEVRDDLKYTDSHEWLRVEGKVVKVGITDHAQSQLTDIVFDELCVVESVKSVSELYAPITGKIANVNKSLEETPETINESPYDKGWLVEIEVTNKSEIDSLLDANSYKKII